MLVDLGGSVFFRSRQNGLPETFDEKIKGMKYWKRPGHVELLKEVSDHPRITFGFYSSIMLKNVVPIMYRILSGDLEPLRNDFLVFD